MTSVLPEIGTTPEDQAALEAWHHAVLERTWDLLPGLLTDEVTYHNPAQLEPLRGKDEFVATLRTVFGVFEDFAYRRYFTGDEGYVLEFGGRVGDRAFTGVDMIRLNAGRISDLVVMLRPFDIVPAIGAALAKLAGAQGAPDGLLTNAD